MMMKKPICSVISLLILALFAFHVDAFSTRSTFSGRQMIATTSKQSNVGKGSQLQMFWGEPKDDGKPGDYVCKDCGYVFTKGPAAWAKLDNDYSSPPCGAPKYRFKKVPKGSASGKVEVKKSWFGN